MPRRLASDGLSYRLLWLSQHGGERALGPFNQGQEQDYLKERAKPENTIIVNNYGKTVKAQSKACHTVAGQPANGGN